jgi:hypothetical protein
MASQQIQSIPPMDGNTFTGPTRTTAGYAKFLSPTSDVEYGEKMRGLYVGTTGNVSIQAWDGSTITFVGLAAGVIHPIFSIKINSSGTTASNIIVCS